MNCQSIRMVCIVCALSMSGLNVPHAQADTGALGRIAMNAVSVTWRNIKKVLPTKPSTIAALCVAGGMTAKFLWTRHVTLRRINEKINPHVKLCVDQQERPIYNWMIGSPGFTTPAQIRANYQQVRAALVIACLSGEVDIFQYGTGNRLTAGHAIYWADVMSSIDVEIAHIRREIRKLESFADISFGGIHFFGVRKNFAEACDNLGISGLDQLRHAMTVSQEEQIDAEMTEDRGLGEKAIALLLANPNYDKAHRIFWELDKRLGRLQAIKEAVVHTRVNWHIALY